MTSRNEKASPEDKERPFSIMETTIAEVHAAFRKGSLTSRQLVQLYLDRIAAYDQQGPKLNAIITLNPQALDQAAKLDAAFGRSGPVGPLHGIPLLIKDQADTEGMPTTLGSVLFRDYRPPRDAFVVDKLKKAGAVILAKATLAEFAAGDTYGSLFGETRNPYDLLRTAGGSSGGPGAGLSANFATIAVGQEGYASIRRPSTWNSLVGMRPTAGLVSRGGVYAGWPSKNGSLGPMTRTVTDLASLLDVMVGYDPEDPLTALGVGRIPGSYAEYLDKYGIQGARLGILRESIGNLSDEDSPDFQNIDAVFDKAVSELEAAGAVLVDPIVIPDIRELLGRRASGPGEATASMAVYLSRNPGSPYKTLNDVTSAPDYDKVFPPRKAILTGSDASPSRHYECLLAREKLMHNLMKVMADNRLDAIVHKSVEHPPTLISEGIKPPYPSMKGAININTFLVFVPAITVPAGFTPDNLPAGITFLGRPYADGLMIKLAFAYEQATRHRRPPATTPVLPGTRPV